MTSPHRSHAPGCALDPVYWLRHAIDATNLRLDPGHEDDDIADRLSSSSLLNALENLAGRQDWRTVTLLQVAEYASLMGACFEPMCTCRRNPSAGPE